MTEKLHINCVSCGNCQHPRDADNLSLFCMECPPNEAPCLKVCPKKAIEILGGAITLNKSKCDKCGELKKNKTAIDDNFDKILEIMSFIC